MRNSTCKPAILTLAAVALFCVVAGWPTASSASAAAETGNAYYARAAGETGNVHYARAAGENGNVYYARAGSGAGNAYAFGFSSDDLFGSGSYLGVDTRDITSDRLGPLHLKEERGVEVTMVDQDAPAGKAGLKEHDVILSINGTQVESVEQLRRLIREVPPGRTITIGVSRDGQPLTLKAELADRKQAFAWHSDDKEFKFEMPAMPAVAPMPLYA